MSGIVIGLMAMACGRNSRGFYEFFAGGGMARVGLGSGWDCLFANDIDPAKAAAYRSAFGLAEELRVGDVESLTTADLPGRADLAWASFPCQDLSLAGHYEGLAGSRSGTFWGFWGLMQGLHREGRAPRMIVLENVKGAITSKKGADLAILCEALAELGYQYAPLVVDAQLFVPQSRPRLFVVAFGPSALPPSSVVGSGPCPAWHPSSLRLALDRLSTQARTAWRWLAPPIPHTKRAQLSALMEDQPRGVAWHSPAQTARLLHLMSPLHQQKVAQAQQQPGRQVGTIYKRTRPQSDGAERCQRAEVRFDGVAGCLRTPVGGSSRQIILMVEGQRLRSRLLSPREAARLMGLPEQYPLPDRYNDAYHLIGDGVAVPVVSFLARTVIEPSIGPSIEPPGVIPYMRTYVRFLNQVRAELGTVDLDEVERFWAEQVRAFFAAKPFTLRLDESLSLRTVIRNLLAQAAVRQKEQKGTTFQGSMLQHLVGAKLDLLLGPGKVVHHSVNQNDEGERRSGDFDVEDISFHVSTAPTEALIQKCQANLNAGRRPILVTTGRGVALAEGLASNTGIGDRLDVLEAEQFLATNLYERGLFAQAQRRLQIEALINRYNELIDEHETDPSLRIELPPRLSPKAR